ncbi:MAG: type II 3-dehydroquinate dehydratase [Synergistetes bacterium]|nr:type II 3-dehydroquinate dehydratase [Synergistota bacterium]
MKFLVINGPNINMLGKREPSIYGKQDYDELCKLIEQKAKELGVEVRLFQSNSEGEIIDFLQKEGISADGIIINAGALSHYSYAIRDALQMLKVPKVSVHISNIYKRETFRHKDVNMEVCDGGIIGLGLDGYTLALQYLYRRVIR